MGQIYLGNNEANILKEIFLDLLKNDCEFSREDNIDAVFTIFLDHRAGVQVL